MGGIGGQGLFSYYLKAFDYYVMSQGAVLVVMGVLYLPLHFIIIINFIVNIIFIISIIIRIFIKSSLLFL